MRVSSHRLGRAALIGVVATMAASILAAPVAAASPPGLYVAKHHSSDANPCSSGQPCLTIGHAVSVATAGATIHVDQGMYAEQVSITQRLTLIAVSYTHLRAHETR